VTARDQALRLVRRARRRLEAARLSKAASRGALMGAVLGLLSLAFTRAQPMLPWAFLVTGALAGLVQALLGKPIDAAAAALYLDRRLGTSERFVTVATLPPDPLTIRVAEELAGERRLPRSPVPREAALVPLAFFLLFAAGLLPRPREEKRASRFVVAPAAAEDGGAEVDAAMLEKLARAERLQPKEAEALREAIEREVRRPEERRAARAALAKAAGGEGASGAEVLRALEPRTADTKGGALLASAYPEATEFVRAYRRALEEDAQ